MPFEVELDIDKKLIVSRWEGAVDESSLRLYVDEAWTDPSRRGYNELVDFSSVTEVDASFEVLQGLADYSRQFDNPDESARSAFVAPTDLIYGLSRMFSAFRTSNDQERRQFSVFDSEEKALSWLGDHPPA